MAGSQRSGPIPLECAPVGSMRQSTTAAGSWALNSSSWVAASVSAASGSWPFGGDDGQVLAQHRPGLGAGQAGVELVGGDVQLGQRGGGGDLVGGFAEGVVVHGGGGAEAGEGVGGIAGCRGGRDLGAVAAQRRGQDVYGGLGVGGFGRDDAVRIGFGGGQIDVVFDPPAG